MEEPTSRFEVELHVSLKSVVALLVVLGVVLAFVRNPQAENPFIQLNALLLGMLLLVASAIALLLEDWNSWASRWFIVILSVVVIALVDGWLRVPGSLVLMAIPTGLAAALIGPPAATATALGETALVFLLPKHVAADTDWVATGVALVAIWAMLGVMYAVYRPVYQFARWSWGCYQNVQRLLEEARDRTAELEQALDDLAHANRQLALINERMTALRLIAEDARKAKSRFVSRVSHEFRAPLNIIIGLVGLMVENPEAYTEELAPDLWKDLEIVHRNCQHLARMVNDVLDLSQAEADPLVLHKERANLAEIIDSALAVVRPLVEKKRLSLLVNLPDDPTEIYCDPIRIRQVILNLLINASRFTERGGIRVHVTKQDQDIIVSVADTGPGISLQDTPRVFEPFYRGSSDLSRSTEGSGLGLSISKQFIELHGGRIWFESEVGAGTTFFFQLPISLSVKPIARPGHQIREDWIWRERAFRRDRVALADQLDRPRIVICDGTGSLYPKFMRYSDKVEFVGARDLAQAARELQQCPAHAVVLNAAVPDELLSLVETVSQNAPGTPIIGCSIPQPIEHVLESGASGYLMKPVARASLAEAIRAAGKPVRRVLVVDDDLDFLSLITRMLHACDSTLEVTAVSSCEQALDELRSRSPDLVLLDIIMADMNGWQLLELLRQDGKTKDVPVFFVSAQDLADQPLVSKFFLATIDEGLSISKLLRCSLDFSAILLEPDRGLDQVPV